MELTALAVKNAKPREKEYKLAAGGGLYLLVTPKGAKYWRMKYRVTGKEKKLAIGVFPRVSLKEAKHYRDEAKKLLERGLDPSQEKRTKRNLTQSIQENSFQSVGMQWFERQKLRWADTTAHKRLRILELDLFPILGERPISEIEPPELLAVLRRIEDRGAIEIAQRAKQISGQVFRFAIASGLAKRDPSVDLKDALITRKPQHFSAITSAKEAGKLMLSIDGYTGSAVVKAALRLSALFFVRPGELRHMEWLEIDWDRAIWELPISKMKMNEPHVVSLSTQAIHILKELEPLTKRSKYVFPSARGARRPMSENAVRVALRTMGYDNETMTAHGFRAMARTLLDEELGFRVDWIEQQLAHTVKDPNGRAYNRTKYLKQRHDMMQAWADYLDSRKAAHHKS